MTNLQKLQKKLPQFTWTQENKHSSIFGVCKTPQTEKRINKDLYKLNNVYIFISSKMGGNELAGKPFRYALCYQKGEVRPYRHKYTHGVEFNKLFVSGKDSKDIINELVNKVDMGKYFLSSQ